MMDREKLRELIKGVAPSYLVALYLVLVLALGMLVSSLLLYPQELRIAELNRQLQAEQQKTTVQATGKSHCAGRQGLQNLLQTIKAGLAGIFIGGKDRHGSRITPREFAPGLQ